MLKLFKRKNKLEDKLLLKLEALEHQLDLVAKNIGSFKLQDLEFLYSVPCDTLPIFKDKDYEFKFEDNNIEYEVHYIKDYPSRSLHIHRKKKMLRIADYEVFPSISISYWKDEVTVRPLLNKNLTAKDVNEILHVVRINTYRLINEVYMNVAEHDIEVGKLQYGGNDEERLYIV